MDFPFFTEDEQPTMAKFNEKLKQSVSLSLEQSGKVEIGSYQGTGEGGEAHPNTITSSFAPKIVMIPWGVISGIGTSLAIGSVFTIIRGDDFWLVDTSVLSTEYKAHIGFGRERENYTLYCKKSPDGKTLFWYNDANSNPGVEQLNASYQRFHYIAIG